MQFNEILTKRRKLLGITQDELAEKLDVSRQSISKWENGECMPEAEKLIKLADILDISLDELTGREKAYKTEPAPAAPPTAAAPANNRLLKGLLIAALCLLIAPVCIGISASLLSHKVPAAPSSETAADPATGIALPDELTVSGIAMNSVSSTNGKYPEVEISFVSNYTYTGEEGVSCTVYFNSAVFSSVSAPAKYDGGTYRVRISADSYKKYETVVFAVKSGDAEKSALIAKQFNIDSNGGFEWTSADGEAHYDLN